jgi:predicted ester cyclase
MDQHDSSAARNKERQRLFVEVLQNCGEIDRVEEFVRPDFENHTARPGSPPGPDGVSAGLAAFRAGFPDHDAEVVHMVAEGDLVATYKTFTGTHTGEFLGISPTGRRVTIRVMDVVRYRDGRIAEHWSVVDLAGARAQIDA